MSKSNSIIWFEWFSKEKERIFKEDTNKIWALSLRNGIAPTIFRKWLREEICKDIKDENFEEKDIQAVENQWANQKKISTEKFTKNRSLILEKVRLSEENFRLYCINELKAVKWAEEKWTQDVEQIYLETKDRYDEVKLQITCLPILEKGLTLEIYQQLKEGEVDFSDVGKINSAIRYQSDPEGSWYKRTSCRKEIGQIISKLKCGDLSAPFKVSNDYTIIKFLEARGTQLTDEIRKRIIAEQMSGFIDYGVEKLLEYVSSLYEGKQ